MGFRTIAIDNHRAGHDLARSVPSPELMPDLVVDSSNAEDALKQIFEFTDMDGVAAAVVCTDSIEVTAWTLSLLRIEGVMVALGLPSESWRLDASLLVFRQLTVIGSYVTSAESTARMMEAVARSGIQSQVTCVPFDESPKLVERYETRDFKGRLVVNIS